MRVVVAPDSFGGSLTPVEAAAAMNRGWQAARGDDEVVVCPLSDGGEGLLDALLAGPMAGAEVHVADVADAAGLATDARWLLHDGVAVVESAEACGLSRLAPHRRDPLRTTTWGVGQLLEAARTAGAERVLVGLGGSATVDGGAGALSGLGFRLTVEDGSGLKVGGQDLPRVTGAARTWVGDWGGLEIDLLADVRAVLADAPGRYGPQKGADAAAVTHLEAGLAAWRAVVESDLGAPPDLAAAPGSGAAGGLGYGLAAGLGARLVAGAEVVADLVGLDGALDGADVVLTGEGRFEGRDPGKVVDEVARRAQQLGVPVVVVAGQASTLVAPGIHDVVASSPQGPTDDAATALAAAVQALAGRWKPPVG